MNAGPPTPIPAWLQPQRAQLGPDDLCVVITTAELASLSAALELELGIGGVPTQVRIVHREGSPWIEVDAHRPALEQSERATVRLALWRYTLAVYRVGDDEAVEDDPIWTPPRQEPTP
jgi:hypothetical protein